MNFAVLYARFSPRPNAAECESIETQMERMRAYCQASGWAVIGEHEDRDLSGRRTDNRPGLQAALDAAARKGCVLLVYSLSRLARNTRDAIDIAERIDAAGGDLASLREKIDTTTAMGRFFFRLMASMAELEREQIAERTADAMRRHQGAGRRMSAVIGRPFGQEEASCLPYGRRADPDDARRLVWDESELAALARIRQLAAEGKKLREIARLMNEAGELCRGKRWHHQQVKRLLARSAEPASARRGSSSDG